MNRRENLKLLFTGTLASGLLLTHCRPADKVEDFSPRISGGTPGGRSEEEIQRDQQLLSEIFFTGEEREKLDVLVDIIIPADAQFGGAAEASVTDFIEFMVKDQPSFQTPIRGGLMWLDNYSQDRYGQKFLALPEKERMEVIDLIAWPDKAPEELGAAVRFFNTLRNLTCTGYFSSEIGFRYLGYKGNVPNVWDGVPDEVMKNHGFEYPEKYLSIYLKPEDRAKVAEWDDEGNLIG